MKNPVWTKAIKTCADPQRARRFLDLLAATSAAEALHKASVDQAHVLTALLSGSQVLGNVLVARPDWIEVLEPGVLKYPRRKQGLCHEVNRWLKPLLAASDFGAALMRLREFKQREMLRIGGRDLARLGNLPEIVQLHSRGASRISGARAYFVVTCSIWSTIEYLERKPCCSAFLKATRTLSKLL